MMMMMIIIIIIIITVMHNKDNNITIMWDMPVKDSVNSTCKLIDITVSSD